MMNKHLWWVMVLAIFLKSCGSGIQESNCENLQEYTQKFLPELRQKKQNTSQKIRVYLDYSMSMRELLNGAINHIENLNAIIEGRDAHFYRMGASNPTEISMVNVRNEIRNLDNYNETRTLLDKSLESIVNEPNQQSVFISDFEMDQGYGRQVTINGEKKETSLVLDAWAKVSFKKWLVAGNQLDFFVNTFNDRKLFIVFFTPQALIYDQNALLHRFTSLDKTKALQHLTFSLTHFSVATRYGSAKGFPEAHLYYDEEQYCQQDLYEYYPLVRSPFIDYIGSDQVAKEEKIFLRKLFLNQASANQLEAQLSLVCYDITKNLTDWLAFKSQMEVDSTSNATFAPQKDKLLRDYFQLKKLPDDELGVVFKPGFDPAEIDAGNTLLLKIMASKVAIKNNEATKRLLTWTTRDGGFEVQALYKSIYEAANEAVLNTTNKLLHAYLLKF